jgi:hypothetical protein
VTAENKGSGRPGSTHVEGPPRVPTIAVYLGAESRTPAVRVRYFGTDKAAALTRLRMTLEDSPSDDFKRGLVAALVLYLASDESDTADVRALVDGVFSPPVPEPVRRTFRWCGNSLVPEGKHVGMALHDVHRLHPAWLRTAYIRGWFQYWTPFRGDLEAFYAELEARGAL